MAKPSRSGSTQLKNFVGATTLAAWSQLPNGYRGRFALPFPSSRFGCDSTQRSWIGLQIRIPVLALILGCGFVNATSELHGATVVSGLTSEPDDKRLSMKVAAVHRDGDVSFEGDSKKAVIHIRSKSGIGGATLERGEDPWPRTVVIRLHLKGLESFRLQAGGNTTEWSISSTGKPTSHQSVIDDQGERNVPVDSERYREVKLVSKRKKIPLRDGFFELQLEGAHLPEMLDELKLEWIDFYR